jgi:hypothetical protein
MGCICLHPCVFTLRSMRAIVLQGSPSNSLRKKADQASSNHQIALEIQPE